MTRVRNRTLIAGIAILSVACLIGCASADAVASFASTSSTALKQGDSIFSDFSSSYLRRQCSDRDVVLKFADQPQPQDCLTSALEQQDFPGWQKAGRDAADVAGLLAAYFDKIHALAAFGTSANGSGKAASGGGGGDAATANAANTAAKGLASKSKSFLSSDVSAVESLANVFVKILTAGYRDRELQKLIQDGNAPVHTITAALSRVIQDEYRLPATDQGSHLLAQERQSLLRRFQDAGPQESDQGVKMLLQADWDQQIGALMSRDAAAKSYCDALAKIAAGQDQLIAQKTKFTAKSIAMALDPYTSDLKDLTTKIQKAHF